MVVGGGDGGSSVLQQEAEAWGLAHVCRLFAKPPQPSRLLRSCVSVATGQKHGMLHAYLYVLKKDFALLVPQGYLLGPGVLTLVLNQNLLV